MDLSFNLQNHHWCNGVHAQRLMQQHLSKKLNRLGWRRKRNHCRRIKMKKRAGKHKNRTRSNRFKLKCINVSYLNYRSAKQWALVLEHMLYDSDVMLLQETQPLQFTGFPMLFQPGKRKLQWVGNSDQSGTATCKLTCWSGAQTVWNYKACNLDWRCKM